MLTKQNNDLLTQVGPGTPMNEVLRRYWLPAMLSADLEPDGDPKRLRLLGENFVAFRDTDGRVGIVDNACCHRGTSLALGRNEQGGLRCIFHGWKYAVDGTIVDMPNVTDPQLKKRFAQPAYPVREAGEVIWVYLGDRSREPAFREYAYMRVPCSHRIVERFDLDCNYLQVMEGGLDSTHVGILHSNLVNMSDLSGLPVQLQRRQPVTTDSAPRIDVRDTEFGFDYAALRRSTDGRDIFLVRVTAYIAPTTVFIPPDMYVVHYIPYDDTHTGWLITHWNPDEPVAADRMKRGLGIDVDGFRSGYSLMMNDANNYLQNRQAMRDGNWSGFSGVAYEDAAVNLAQGPILDRTKEHLVQADAACTRVRRLLLDAIKKVQRGEDPPGLSLRNAGAIQALDFAVSEPAEWPARVPGNIALPQTDTASVG